MVDYQAMGKRMKAKRRSLNLSQEELAKSVQISMSFYGNIERGKRIPSIDTLVAIANVLGVGTDYLLMDSVNTAKKMQSAEEIRTVQQYLRDRMAELDFGDEND